MAKWIGYASRYDGIHIQQIQTDADTEEEANSKLKDVLKERFRSLRICT